MICNLVVEEAHKDFPWGKLQVDTRPEALFLGQRSRWKHTHTIFPFVGVGEARGGDPPRAFPRGKLAVDARPSLFLMGKFRLETSPKLFPNRNSHDKRDQLDGRGSGPTVNG